MNKHFQQAISTAGSIPYVSIIVPVYNTSKYLRRCIDSIIVQSLEEIEIILVDDGSTDGSYNICEEYANNDSRIAVIHKENGGLSSARNAGIKIANGEYIGFIDSDDTVDKNMYLHMYRAAMEHQGDVVCCGRYDYYDDLRKKGLAPQKNEVISPEDCVGRILIWDGMDSSACDKLFHKRLFECYNFPDGKLSEDVAVMYKIILAGTRIVLISERLYCYHHRNNSITTSAFNDKSFDIVNHSKEIGNYIKLNHPKISLHAKYFRVCSLMYGIDLIVDNGLFLKKTYSGQYYQYNKELKRGWMVLFRFDKGISGYLHILKAFFMRYRRGYIFIRKIYKMKDSITCFKKGR